MCYSFDGLCGKGAWAEAMARRTGRPLPRGGNGFPPLAGFMARRRNSLHSLRSLWSNSRRQSVHEACCARGPRNQPAPATHPDWRSTASAHAPLWHRHAPLAVASEQMRVDPRVVTRATGLRVKREDFGSSNTSGSVAVRAGTGWGPIFSVESAAPPGGVDRPGMSPPACPRPHRHRAEQCNGPEQRAHHAN